MNFKRSFLVFISAFFLLSCGSSVNPNWKLVWSDEFDYQGLPDSTKWDYDTAGNAWAWGNNELQWYTNKIADNAQVKDGCLKINAILHEPYGDLIVDSAANIKKYTSARLITKHQANWKYCKVEVRAKLPHGRGTWPAIWMMPTADTYGNWPKSGEIDIMEHVGYQPNEVFSTVHTSKFNHIIGTQVGKSIVDSTLTTQFHLYTLEWEENELRSYKDGQLYFVFKRENGSDAWPFDQSFYLILNLAIGGGLGGKMGVDNNLFPHSMEVDYVRVYQK